MNTAICTLFEGDYHYGVGGLVNSLFRQGFRGMFLAGYRGNLPPWATAAVEVPGGHDLSICDGVTIRFVPVQATCHLTNHKPAFMQRLWRDHCPNAELLFYFDPDIVVKCPWTFFEEWASCGVALCEDINSPMPASHPIRHAWKAFCQSFGVCLDRDIDSYANGGFVGLKKCDNGFLDLWSRIIEQVGTQAVASLDQMIARDRPAAYYIADQDALNSAMMSSDYTLSLVGPSGMDFVPGGYIMAHAAGGVKPWRKRFIREALGGVPASSSDRAYWRHTDSPIELFPMKVRRHRRLLITIASAIGRFYHRR